MRIALVIAFMSLLTFSCMPNSTDEQLEKKIQGTWRAEYSEPIKAIGEGTYNADGTHVGSMRFYEKDGSVKEIEVSFRWWIEDGQLFSTEGLGDTKASKKVVSVDTIVSIEKDKMLLKTPDGRLLVRTRVR